MHSNISKYIKLYHKITTTEYIAIFVIITKSLEMVIGSLSGASRKKVLEND